MPHRQDSVIEPQRNIPVLHEADVVVVGGSCTGVFAAVRAARLGMRVAIIEKHNCFGGMATAGNVNVWHSLRDTREQRQIIGGLTVEMLERLERRGAVSKGTAASSAYRLNTEELKIELDELVGEHDIRPFLHTLFAAPVVEDGRVTGVIIENKNGRQAIRGRQFVDATGDGDLARALGAPVRRPAHLQPPTTCAKIAGMDGLGEFDWTRAVREHGHEFGLKPDWGWGGPIPGLDGIQMRADTHVFDTDGSDAEQLTAAEIEGRRQVRALLDVIRTYGPAEAKVGLVDLAAAIGIRQTPQIACKYQLTGEDLLTGRRFDDAIANGSYRVDIHHEDGPGITFRYLDGTEEIVPERGARSIRGRWREPIDEDPTFYQVPLRCLLQEAAPNLMLAGRMLDADRVAFSAVRVMVNTNQMGEAAGVACALAIRDGVDAAHVEPAQLRSSLSEGGSIVV
jgi:2-polyprenyl-6-methoxyphenol hydroxylase-like FAD-dependent oxidoreductase